MFCPKCGKPNVNGAVFCADCGHKLPITSQVAPPPSTTKPPKKKGFNPLIILIPILLVVLFVLAIVVGFIIWQFTASSPTQEEPATEIIVATEAVERESYYGVFKSDDTWTSANVNAIADGGELVSVNSVEEFNKICALAEDCDLRVFWIGARRSSYNWDYSNWLDGTKIEFAPWYPNEPSYVSEEGNDENYLMVFKVNGSWYFNDAENDVSSYYSGKMGYIVEYVK